MAREIWANNAQSTLSAGIDAVDTSISVVDGSSFPLPASEEFFYATLVDGSTIEIVKVTARSGSTLTVERGQQGTSATSFPSGAAIQNRLTSRTLYDLRDEIVLASGFSVSDYLKSANGTLSGSTTMTIGALVRMGRVERDAEGDADHNCIVSHGTAFSQGYRFGSLFTRPVASAADAGFTMRHTSNTHPSWVGSSGAADGQYYQFANFKTAVMALHFDSPYLTLWVNGIKWRRIQFVDAPGYTPGSNGMYVGNQLATEGVWTGGIAGVVYAESAFTDAQMRQWTLDCMDALDVVDGGLAFDHLYSFKQMGLGHGEAVPSTVSDQIGSTNLSLNGSLSVRVERPRWL